MATALIYHPIYLRHDTPPHHPERPSRVQAILRKLQKTRLIDRLKVVEPDVRHASIENLCLVHSKDYIAHIEEACRTCEKTHFFKFDPDTFVSQDSYKAGLFAVAGALTAIDIVFNKDVDNAFCLVRPPGHHARKSQAMGFCLFNNVAIGARYLQNKHNIKRILIIDWDVHHGNGTEEIFYEDPGVYYISLHQYPHYPGTGAKSDIGKGEGKGFNLNIPMPPGSGDKEYLDAFNNIIEPIADDFKPEFILISAGFDGHRDDPLSSINLTEIGFKKMTELVKEIGERYSKGRIVSVLEGGYNLFALGDSVNVHLEALI